MVQSQGVRRHDRDGADRFACPGENVEDHVGGMNAFRERFPAGGLDRGQAVAEDRSQNTDHLTAAIGRRSELAANTLEARRQDPVLERRPVAQRAGLPRQHRDIVRGIIDRLVAAEAAWMFADDPALLAEFDAIGIGADLSGSTALATTE